MNSGYTPPKDDIELLALKKGAPWTATKSDAIPVDRPVVIYFPGLGHFNDRKLSHETMEKMQRFVSEYFYNDNLTNTDQAVFLARREETHTSTMEKAQIDIHSRDETHFCAGAKAFVDKYFAPLIPELSASASADEDVKKAQLAMSNILMVGQSLGTSYIQQVRNALEEHLHSKGYDDGRAETVLSSLAGLSLSSCIPLNDRGNKDMPTLHIMLDGDRVLLQNNIDPEVITMDDTHPHLATHRAGSHLLMMPRYKGDQQILSAKLVPLVDEVDRENPTSSLQLKDDSGKPRVQWAMETCVRQDDWRHDPRSVLNINQSINPLQYTFQSAAGADVVQQYVDQCLIASKQAAASGTPRNTNDILSKIETVSLSEKGREASNTNAESGAKYFQEMVDFSKRFPSSGLQSR